MSSRKLLNKTRLRRDQRVRARIIGTSDVPRLTVFRSNKGIFAQLIDDSKHHTLASVSVKDLGKTEQGKPKKDQAAILGEMIGKKAAAAGISKAVFDRGEYAYHGRVQSFADGARKGGLKI